VTSVRVSLGSPAFFVSNSSVGIAKFPFKKNNYRLEGTAENDVINGFAGDVWISGNRGDDRIDGGAGNDRIVDYLGNNEI